MPFVYEDSFNGDEDLCRVLRALSLGPSSENGQPPSSPPVVTQGRPRPRVGVVDTDGYPLDSEHWVEYPEPADGSLVIPNTTENTSITTPQPSERTYDVSSTMGTSQVTGWCVILHTFVLFTRADFFGRDRVGHITFTDPSSRARRVLPPSLAAHNNHRAKRGRGQKYVAYVVFEGLQPGIYKTWYVSFPVTLAFKLMMLPGMRPNHWSMASVAITTKVLPLFWRLSDVTSLQVPLAVLWYCPEIRVHVLQPSRFPMRF